MKTETIEFTEEELTLFKKIYLENELYLYMTLLPAIDTEPDRPEILPDAYYSLFTKLGCVTGAKNEN